MRKKNIKIAEYKPSSKTILYQLICEAQWLPFLKEKPYQKLIDYILSLASLKAKELDYSINIKDAELAIQDKRVTKWLPLIVEDLIELNWDKPELFKIKNHEQLYQLRFTEYHENKSFYFNLWLNKALQVYDNFHWDFVKTKLSSHYYWVSEITHLFESGELVTRVNLVSGSPNKYLEQLKDRAIFENKLSAYQLLTMNNLDIEQKLRIFFSHLK